MRLRETAALAALAAAVAGCETFQPSICDRSAEGNPSVAYKGGTTMDGVYMTSPWDGELLNFPGGMHYELFHGLGTAPRWVSSYLSFAEYGTLDGGSLGQAAGNQVVILGMDETSIRLANDSCADYWLLVAAGTAGTPSTPP